MADSFDSDSEDIPKKRCNWCNQNTKLAPNKPYCKACSIKIFRECKRCHKPYPEEKYFEKNENRCNSCQEKYLREREKRLQKLTKKNTKELTSSDDDFSEKKSKNSDHKTSDYFPPSKKVKKHGDTNKIIIKNRRKKYLVFYETDEYSD